MAETEKQICSKCGLCTVDAWPASESIQACVFTGGWLGAQEKYVFGRERSLDSSDEMLFGISSRRFCGRMKDPLPDGQFTGIITGIARKAFETGMVDAVATLHRSSEDYFLPVPVLAVSAEDILAGSGSKPVLANVLTSLEKAYHKGIRRLLVVGASCHVHNLRAFKRRFPYLEEMDLYVVGIPCTDNVDSKHFRYILSRISRSHETVRHYEFMQDFTVHLRHTDGTLERVPFFSLPGDLSSADLLTPSCRSCFDYMNSLADITVGYMGAPLDIEKMYQWVLVRTDKGEQLLGLIAEELEAFAEASEGDRTPFVQMYAAKYGKNSGGQSQAPADASMSVADGLKLAEHLYSTGPQGAEFARYGIETHLIRNYFFVKEQNPGKLKTLVPRHVYQLLESYCLEP